MQDCTRDRTEVKASSSSFSESDSEGPMNSARSSFNVAPPSDRRNAGALNRFSSKNKLSEVRGINTTSTQHSAQVSIPSEENDDVRHPDYQTEQARLNSYKEWKSESVISQRCLARNGFFFDGYMDNVTCYFCGLGVRNWTRGDNPRERHRELVNFCGLVKVWDASPCEEEPSTRISEEQDGNTTSIEVN